jgi:hypothetical protein
MKKQILLSFVLSCSFTALLFSCGPSREEVEQMERNKGLVKAAVPGYDIIEIDGCEYIRRTSAQGEVLTHKGNCKNHTK